ncbi:Galactoside O-acetyltransferase [uncultured Roseburia sp.]|uniref:Acyltransferase n=1 Tax=Brotonthovivens ammoniilytica TaxID=2981725 RepID=A0ABT2TKE4_9FIRM|nr:acyltransferase [Brotonthovivens ammoniilytica]MCU6762684.1 acyltransferase [Brotonthovivens ammoniilytica]SCI84691.1 Galactoside O-acetyltransferase [uncultured Roseburia sp.]
MKKLKNLMKRYQIFVRKFWFQLLKNGFSRADYLRKHDILAEIGENVYFYSRIMPADPKLLKIHSNVSIATNVRFVNHDRIDVVLSGMFDKKYGKKYDCIEIMDNVFIGADVIVLPGVKIGPNAIVGAGSVVTHDVLPGTVVGGSPARKIASFDETIEKRLKPVKPVSSPEKLWAEFNKKHKD